MEGGVNATEFFRPRTGSEVQVTMIPDGVANHLISSGGKKTAAPDLMTLGGWPI